MNNAGGDAAHGAIRSGVRDGKRAKPAASISELIGIGGAMGSSMRAPWPRYKASPDLGCKSVCGRMAVGEEHHGLHDCIPYTIRRVR